MPAVVSRSDNQPDDEVQAISSDDVSQVSPAPETDTNSAPKKLADLQSLIAEEFEPQPSRENVTQERDDESEPQTLRAPLAETESSNKIDILVAEDNEVNQIVITQILQSTGYSYLIANNGAEAVELYQKHHPRVICMDVSMPVMNGHDATRKIRELELVSNKHTPIIGVTAHAIKGDMERCFDAGMDDYLSKPVSPEKLEDKVVQWVNHTQQIALGVS